MLTTDQAAQILGIRASTVSAYIRRGLIRARKLGPIWVVSDLEVVRFARDRRGLGYPKGRPRR